MNKQFISVNIPNGESISLNPPLSLKMSCLSFIEIPPMYNISAELFNNLIEIDIGGGYIVLTLISGLYNSASFVAMVDKILKTLHSSLSAVLDYDTNKMTISWTVNFGFYISENLALFSGFTPGFHTGANTFTGQNFIMMRPWNGFEVSINGCPVRNRERDAYGRSFNVFVPVSKNYQLGDPENYISMTINLIEIENTVLKMPELSVSEIGLNISLLLTNGVACQIKFAANPFVKICYI